MPLIHLNDALALVIQLAQDYASKHRQYSLLPIYVRLVKTDDLFLSPASKFRPDGSIIEENCYIEVRETISSAYSMSNSCGGEVLRGGGGRVLVIPFRGPKSGFVPLRMFILKKRSTTKSVAVAFRVISRKNYDRRGCVVLELVPL